MLYHDTETCPSCGSANIGRGYNYLSRFERINGKVRLQPIGLQVQMVFKITPTSLIKLHINSALILACYYRRPRSGILEVRPIRVSMHLG